MGTFLFLFWLELIASRFKLIRDQFMKMMKFLLKSKIVDVNIPGQSNKTTGLHQACYRGDIEVIILLLKNGASIQITSLH